MNPDISEVAFFLSEGILASVHAKTSESAHLNRSPEWLGALFTRMCVTKFVVSKCPDSCGCSLMLRRPRSFAVLSLLFLSHLIYSVRSRVHDVRAIVNFHQSERLYHRGITIGEGEKRRGLGRQSIKLLWMGRD